MIWLKSFLEGIDCKEYVREFFGTIGDSHVKSLEKSMPKAFSDIMASSYYEGSLQNWINNQIFCYTDGKSKETNIDELTWALCMGYVHPRDVMVVVMPNMKLPEECWITYEELSVKMNKVKSSKGVGIKPKLSSYEELKRATRPIKTSSGFGFQTTNNPFEPNYYSETLTVGPNGPIKSKEKPERTGTVIIKTGKLPFLIREMSIELLEQSLKTIDSPRYVEAITNELNHKKGIKVSSEESGEVVIPKRRSLEGYTDLELDSYIRYVKELNTPSEKEIKDLMREAEEAEMYEKLKESHNEKKSIKVKKMPDGYNPVLFIYLKDDKGELIFDGQGLPIVIGERMRGGEVRNEEDFRFVDVDRGLDELEEDQEMYEADDD
jgi:hypothetical protein